MRRWNDLPEDLLVIIFKDLSPEELFALASHGCVRFQEIISERSFVKEYFQQTKSGVLVTKKPLDEEAQVTTFMEHSDSEFVSIRVLRDIPNHYRVMRSTQGMVLFRNLDGNYGILNPITNQVTHIPRIQEIDCPIANKSFHISHESGESESESESESETNQPDKNKVVHAIRHNLLDGSTNISFAVLTLMVDQTWRNLVNADQFNVKIATISEKLSDLVLSIQSFVFWPYFEVERNGLLYFLAMDMSTERIKYIPQPGPSFRDLTYVEQGDTITAFRRVDYRSVEIYQLTKWDDGQWTTLMKIDLPVLFWRCHFFPCAWLSKDKSIIFETGFKTGFRFETKLHGVYSVKSQEMISFAETLEEQRWISYTPSLMRW